MDKTDTIANLIECKNEFRTKIKATTIDIVRELNKKEQFKNKPITVTPNELAEEYIIKLGSTPIATIINSKLENELPKDKKNYADIPEEWYKNCIYNIIEEQLKAK